MGNRKSGNIKPRKPKLSSSLFTCFSAINSCSDLLPPSHVMMMSPDQQYPCMSPDHRIRALDGRDPRNWDDRESTSLLLSLWQRRIGSFGGQQEQNEPTSPRVTCTGQVQIHKSSLLEDHESSIIKQKRWEKFLCAARSHFPSLEPDVVRTNAQHSDLSTGPEKASMVNSNCKQKVMQGKINSSATGTSSVCSNAGHEETVRKRGSLAQSREFLDVKDDQRSHDFSFEIPHMKAPEQQQLYAFPPIVAQNSRKKSGEVCIWKRRCFAEPVRLNLLIQSRVG